jgi:ribosomal protein L11 methyltransferase
MSWLQLKLAVPAAQAEPVSEAMEEAGALAVTLEPPADRPLYEPAPGEMPLAESMLVVGLFAPEADAEAVLCRIAARLEGPLPACTRTTLEDQDWTRAWMAQFRPLRFGERLWVCPSWCAPPDPQAVNVLLDPGLAFGTGTHPTTALCLRWLGADGALAGARVVDYGCGSGILGIAAARLGANEVWAVDIDPQALEATRRNAEANGVAAAIKTMHPDALGAVQADVLLANILAGPLQALAGRLAALVRPGGDIVLSGVLADQAAGCRAAYEGFFDMDSPMLEEEWVMLHGVRRGPAGGADD